MKKRSYNVLVRTSQKSAPSRYFIYCIQFIPSQIFPNGFQKTRNRWKRRDFVFFGWGWVRQILRNVLHIRPLTSCAIQIFLVERSVTTNSVHPITGFSKSDFKKHEIGILYTVHPIAVFSKSISKNTKSVKKRSYSVCGEDQPEKCAF